MHINLVTYANGSLVKTQKVLIDSDTIWGIYGWNMVSEICFKILYEKASDFRIGTND